MKNLITFLIGIVVINISNCLFSQTILDSNLNDSGSTVIAGDSLTQNDTVVSKDSLTNLGGNRVNGLEVDDSIVIDSALIFVYPYSSKYEFNKKLLDTTINRIHRYDPVQRDNARIYSTLGNIGLPAASLIFDFNESVTFNRGEDALTSYLFNAATLEYYDLYRPFTEVIYVTGGEKERVFDILHAQKVTDFITTGLEYKLVNSPGKYTRQGAKNAHFSINFNVSTNEARYVNRLAYSHNRIDISENGGITDVNELETRGYDATVEFPSSHQVSNWIKTNTYYFDHSLAFGKYKSIDSSTNRYKHSIGYIGHEFKFDRSWSIYEDADPTSGYYLHTFKDTASTYDSLYTKTIENDVYWSNYRSETYGRKLNFRFGITHQYIDVAQTDGDYTFNSFNFYDTTYVYGKLQSTYLISRKNSFNSVIPNVFVYIRDIFSGFNLVFDGRVGISGYSKEDFVLKGSLFKTIHDSSRVFAAIGYSQQEPDWVYKKNISNNFIWNSGLDKITSRYLSVGGDLPKANLRADLKVGQLLNYTYFDKFARPNQYYDELSYVKAQVSKTFNFWRFGFENVFTYQKFDNENVIHLPEFLSYQSLYLKLSLFKEALHANIGADLTYFTSYYQDSYMPATRQFYLQNEEEIGDYPYIDLFANFKIRTVRMFMKFAHFNSGMMGYEYFKVPNYPADTRGFKFGIIWKFYN